TRHYRAKLTSGGCVTYTNAITVTVTTNNTWRGTANSDWNNPANWSCGEVPTALRNVVISPTFTENYPVISAAAFANNLTVQQDASLTVNAAANFENVTNSGVINVNNGAVLTVTSSLVNNAPAEDFTIADNAGLLQLNTNVNVSAITVQKNSSLLYRQDYTLWASPVIGQNLQEFSPVTLPNRFYTYNPASDLYTTVDPATTDFETGVSYLIRMPNQSSVPGYNNGSAPINFEGTFMGIPHNGTIERTLSTDGSGYN